MEARGSFKIKKLQESNFHVSKKKVELVLTIRERDYHIYDPQAPSDPKELREWKSIDAKAKTGFGLLLSDEHLEHVQGIESVFEM